MAVPATAVAAGLAILTAQGALGVQFAISGMPFTVTATELKGTGFEQFGALDHMVEDSPNEGDTGGQVLVVTSAIKNATLTKLCQSVDLGGINLLIKAGSDGQGAGERPDDRLAPSCRATPPSTTSRSATTPARSTRPGVKGPKGVFSQQADTVAHRQPAADQLRHHGGRVQAARPEAQLQRPGLLMLRPIEHPGRGARLRHLAGPPSVLGRAAAHPGRGGDPAHQKASLKVVLHVGMQGLAGYLLPALMLLCGLLILFNPAQRLFYSIVGILLSLGTWVTSNLGGFFVGLLLGAVGSCLAFGWLPDQEPRASRSQRRMDKEKEEGRATMGDRDAAESMESTGPAAADEGHEGGEGSLRGSMRSSTAESPSHLTT